MKHATDNYRSLQNVYAEKIPDLSKSLTSNASQKDCETRTKFPLCPKEITSNSIEAYEANFKNGEIFERNQYSESIIESFDTSAKKYCTDVSEELSTAAEKTSKYE